MVEIQMRKTKHMSLFQLCLNLVKWSHAISTFIKFLLPTEFLEMVVLIKRSWNHHHRVHQLQVQRKASFFLPIDFRLFATIITRQVTIFGSPIKGREKWSLVDYASFCSNYYLHICL